MGGSSEGLGEAEGVTDGAPQLSFCGNEKVLEPDGCGGCVTLEIY